ncbi:MAG: SH3 domain-containing protein [Anaerolineaceae bacterium]|nr:SH3 domain-containing protein [Anaerolineaceae bacterium]
MNLPTRALFYDLFKFIVALILTLLLVFLTWSRRAQMPPQAIAPTALRSTESSVSPTSTTLSPTALPTTTPTVIPAVGAISASETPPPAAPNAASSATATAEAPLATAATPAEAEICKALSYSQLAVGEQAVVQRNLNFRSSPGIANNWIKTNLAGAQVKIVGGPECMPHEAGGSYVWWQIELADGQVGWSAEASSQGSFYFLASMK